MTNQLPPLRRKKRRVDLARFAGLVSRGVASINATIEPRAAYWDEHNAEAVLREGPLWIALGDSVTQGIGSSEPGSSYVAQVLDRLRTQTGEPWRLVNLSMSGARFADVRTRQLPVIEIVGQPRLVTAIIGSNDVIWRRNVTAIASDAAEMVAALPTGTFLSRLSEAKPDARRVRSNAVFEIGAVTNKLRLFEAWDWPTNEGMWAQDRFHPNDRAHGQLAENLWQSLVSHGALH